MSSRGDFVPTPPRNGEPTKWNTVVGFLLSSFLGWGPEKPTTPKMLLALDMNIVLCDLACTISFLLFAKNVRKYGLVGTSMQTFVGLTLIRVLHLKSHLFGIHYQGQMVGMWVFELTDFLTLVAGLFAVYCLWLSRGSYEPTNDDFGKHILPTQWMKERAHFFGLPLSAFLVSWIFFCQRLFFANESGLTVKMMYFCSLVDASNIVVFMPQLWGFHKMKKVPGFLADFVVFAALQKFFTLVFWFFFPYVMGWIPANRTSCVLGEAVGLLMVSDFFYFYLKERAYPVLIDRSKSKEQMMEFQTIV